jgi:hypothetical protein
VLDNAWREPRGWRPERGGKVALGVDVDGENAFSGTGAEQRKCRGHRAPARPSLAHDEDDPPPQQRGKFDPLSGDRVPNRR